MELHDSSQLRQSLVNVIRLQCLSKHDELDTYLPAFRATVSDAKAGSVMCAYNSINGEPACANQFLLENQLRGKWGFEGYVVSDCDAVADIFSGHHFKKSQTETSAISLKMGMDNECSIFNLGGAVSKDANHDTQFFLAAVKQHLLKESDINVAVARLFTARMKLGIFDPPEMVPYSKIDEKELDSASHRALARKVANESMVLLKNDGVLPLKTAGTKIAVIGPLANQTTVLLGNYSGHPSHTVSVLEGLRAEFSNATINYVPGTQFLSKDVSPVPAGVLSTDGKPGVKANYFIAGMMEMMDPASKPKLIATRIEPGIDTSFAPPPIEVASVKPLLIKWEATLTPEETGDYNLGMQAVGAFRLLLDGKEVTMDPKSNGKEARTGRVHLEKGKSYQISAQYAYSELNNMFAQNAQTEAQARLVWSKVNNKPNPEAVEAAKAADVVVAVVGITSELEGEEMNVNEEGFKGGDRTSLDLPNTTVVDRVGAEANRAFDSGSTWLGIDVVFATGTNAADVRDRAIRATAIR
jgi:beta-glucosidase